jgi:hypothetical protein
MNQRADASVVADMHIFARIGDRYWETPRCRSALLPWVTFSVRGHILTSQLVPEFDAIGWPWPTWRCTKRPFDWAEDQADLPHPPRGLQDDRRRWTFPLRPPAPVVQP